MNTKVVRLPLAEATPLDQRIANLCEVYLATGFKLAAMAVVGTDAILVFQKAT
jgi:hypothetical protein